MNGLVCLLVDDAFRYVRRSLVVARLAQLAERKTLNLVVVGSSPTVGIAF